VFAEGPPLSLPAEFLRLAILPKIPDYVGGDDLDVPPPTGGTPAAGPGWLWGPGGLFGLRGERQVVRPAAAVSLPAAGTPEPGDGLQDDEWAPDPSADQGGGLVQGGLLAWGLLGLLCGGAGERRPWSVRECRRVRTDD
jgi:hypothetical protein